MVGEGSSGRNRLAVDSAPARDRSVFIGATFDAGAQNHRSERAFYLGRDRPGSVSFGECDILQVGAAQAAARRKERNGFDKIGLARSIGPDQGNAIAIDLDLRGTVAAEARQAETTDAGARHFRDQLSVVTNQRKAPIAI
jgi:hypothetical protein